MSNIQIHYNPNSNESLKLLNHNIKPFITGRGMWVLPNKVSLFNDVSQKVISKHLAKKSIAVAVLGNICVGPTGCLNVSAL